MRLARTNFAYEETVAHLGVAGRNPLIEAYLVQYLLVAFYAEVEEKVKDIISSRLLAIEDRKVASFVFKTHEGMLKRVKKADINDVLQKFDCGEGDIIGRILSEKNLQPYFDAIVNRHKVSHDNGALMTLDYFGEALPCAEAILDTLEATLSAQ